MKNRRWRPSLRSLLIGVNLVILLLPLGGIAVLRIYESALIRQTESELIAQGAFIAASYRAAFARVSTELGYPPNAVAHYGRLADAPFQTAATQAQRWRPRPAQLDLADQIVYPPRPEPRGSGQAPDPIAARIGAELGAVLREAQRVTLAGMRLVDYQGIVVASTGFDQHRSLAHLPEIQKPLTGQPIALLRERELDQPPPALNSISRGALVRVVVSTPILRENRVLGAVLLARTPNTIGEALYGKRWLLLQIGLGLLFVVLVLSLFTALTISRPIAALVKQTQRARRGETGAVTLLNHPVTRELEQLSRSVTEMARVLEQRADYIRGFAAHVSHEFKTPISAMKGALELLSDHRTDMSPSQQVRFIENLQADVDRLERLVRRLLELARADVFKPAGQYSQPGPVIEKLANDRRGQEIITTGTRSTNRPIAMGEEIFQAVLENLLDNAQQHGDSSKPVKIECQQSDSECQITIDNHGPAISAGNASLVFEPFFTTARERGGTGLGLAIVRALLTAHGGRVEGLSQPEGARFRLSIPNSPTDQ